MMTVVEGRDAHDKAMAYSHVALADIKAMATYFGVDVRNEQDLWLLSIVKHAILAPLPTTWSEESDDIGNPIFVHLPCVLQKHGKAGPCFERVAFTSYYDVTIVKLTIRKLEDYRRSAVRENVQQTIPWTTPSWD
jgi:hypothetical protein